MKVSVIIFSYLLQATHSFTLQRPQNNKNGVSTGIGYNPILMSPLEKQQSHHFSSVSLHLSSNVDYAEAEDVKSIKSLFSKYADDSDLMTKDTLCKVPLFDEMLEMEDLSMEELTEIWDAAPKSGEDDESRIGADSFVQIYQAVDDLFEDDEEVVDVVEEAKSPENVELNAEQSELKVAFDSLCDDNKLISKAALKAWDEIEKLLADNLLEESEFDDLWSKSAASSEQLDLTGFLSFNTALDDLFEDGDEEAENEPTQTEEPALPANKKMVQGDDLPPGVLFAAIADEDYLVGMNELKLWAELQDMLEEGDLLPSELQSFYDSIGDKKSGKLSEEGFATLFEKIDALFEDDVEEEANGDPAAAIAEANRVKEDLLGFIDLIDDDDDEEALPCGLDSTEKDQKQIMNIVSALEAQPTNFIKRKNGNIDASDLTGTWEMVYSSSNAMKFNKGLSGIGGSFPNGRFGGLKQTLRATKYVRDVEYQEWIEVTPSAASFYVTITGGWDLKTSMSLFTGEPSIVLNIEPDKVEWGSTSTRGDHWKSLGPTNLLDMTYLDDDFRVMRGCTSTETLFLYKRVAEDKK
mmetsp:Transcript_996/g.1934  ORF Transcript_996/g.1934 Transcript_996/m.1934 type:complete len:579 (-) Transcript_996:3161-4897(-)